MLLEAHRGPSCNIAVGPISKSGMGFQSGELAKEYPVEVGGGCPACPVVL